MKKIYIFSGKIRTGKTTRLFNWSKSRDNIDGILSPVKDGKRYLHHIKTGEEKLLEADEKPSGKNHIKIGRFIFNKETFEWGKEKLLSALSENPAWLIIDEVGPLELKGEGFEPVISRILSEKKAIKNINILIVVREGLVDLLFEKFKFTPDTVDNFNFD